MDILIRPAELPKNAHPPYLDPALSATLGKIFHSEDGRLVVNYWEARGPGKLTERPKADELICIIEGQAVVERDGRTRHARPGDVIPWLTDNPAIITVTDTLRAICIAYQPDGKAKPE